MLFSRSLIPTLPLLGLSESEKATIENLQARANACRHQMELAEAYYLGEQVVENLRIAIPKELEFLRTIVGWPAMAVDPYVERLFADGFRVPTATDADQHIADLMDENGFDSEQSLSFTDALSMGRGYWCVGSPPESGAAPLVTVESPRNMAVEWDSRGLNAKSAMQEYWADGRRCGALMVPGKTIQLAINDDGAWEITDRDEHGFDLVPVVRMPHKARTHDRDGRSAITPALRSLTDMACRTLLGLEVSRELYSVPQRVILGAAESSFVGSDGTPKSAFDTYITKVLGLERDEDGNLPEIRQLQPYDPSVFTKLLDWYASAAAGEVAATPQDMGLYTQGNPASAEAVQAGESRRDRRAVKMQAQFGVPLVRVAQMMLRFDNKGVLPREYERLKVDWAPVTSPNKALDSDAISKQVAAGAIPPTSDVTLKALGYSAVDRARLEQDRKTQAGKTAQQQIVDALNGNGNQQGSADGNPAGL